MIVNIKLPQDTQLLVEEKSSVSIGDPLYEIAQEDIQKVPVSDKLGIKPHDIFASVKVVVGDEIKKNDVLAAKKRLVGYKTISSPISGVVTKINHETGDIDISQSGSSTKQVNSFFKASIKSYDKTKGILSIEVKDGEELTSKGISADGGGELYYMLDERDYFHINESDIKDRHIVLPALQSHMVTKLEALSAQGVVTHEGEPSNEFSCIIIDSDESFNKLIKQKYQYILYSAFENKVIAYN